MEFRVAENRLVRLFDKDETSSFILVLTSKLKPGGRNLSIEELIDPVR